MRLCRNGLHDIDAPDGLTEVRSGATGRTTRTCRQCRNATSRALDRRRRRRRPPPPGFSVDPMDELLIKYSGLIWSALIAFAEDPNYYADIVQAANHAESRRGIGGRASSRTIPYDA